MFTVLVDQLSEDLTAKKFCILNTVKENNTDECLCQMACEF